MALVQQGSKLAQSGDTTGATAKFAQALTVDPTLAFDPAQKAAQGYAGAFVSHGYDLGYAGDVEGAIAKFRQALTIDPTLEINPELQAKQTCASVSE